MSDSGANLLPTTLRKFSRRHPRNLFVIPLGIGNAFSTRFYNASFLLLANGSVLLVDAPAPLGRILQERLAQLGFQGNLQTIDGVFLTHLHGDHCNGLEELAFWCKFVGNGPKPRLHLMQELVEPLWEHRLKGAMGRLNIDGAYRDMTLADYFDVRPFRCGTPLDLAIPGVRAEAFPTQHGIPTSALSVEFEGSSLAYSADTPFDPELIRWMAKSQLLIHEVSPGAIHTDYGQLLQLDPALLGRMRLIHFSDVFDLENSKVEPLREGVIYQVIPEGARVIN